MPEKKTRQCIDVAYSLLARREHARLELKQKLLMRKECASDDVDTMLTKLEEASLLSDERYTEMIVRSGLHQGHGRLKITHKLRGAGVDDLLISQYLEQADIDWRSRIHELRLRKYGKELPREYKERARLSRFFASRGFDTELIRTELEL